jgi:hypothetical protein
MPIEDENTALESSTDATLDAADAPEGRESEAAESSTANDVKDTLSIVRDVVAEKTEGQSESSTDGGEEAPETEVASRVTKEPDDEGYTDVPFHKHPRFQHLIQERNVLRDDAVRYRNVRSFLDENGVSDAEAADALMITSLLKSDPVQAWAKMKPIVEAVLHAAGEILPQDLEQRVQAGELPRDVAVQMNRQHAQVRSLETRQQIDYQRQQSRAQREAGQRCQDAAMSWERDRQVKDPNYAAKQAEIMKEVNWLQRQQGSVPNTPDAVREMLDKAYKNVSASFKAPAPRRPAARPSSISHGADAQPAPKSTLEIIRAKTANRRGM